MSQFLEGKKKRYIIGITADKFQLKARKELAKLGFKEIVTFKSLHNTKDEFLTLWYKCSLKTPKTPKTAIHVDRFDLPFSGNCSAGISPSNKRLVIKVRKDAKDDVTGFIRIKNSPIYYKVNPKFIKEKTK